MTKPPGKFEERAESRTRGACRLPAHRKPLITTALCPPLLALSTGAGATFGPLGLLNTNGSSQLVDTTE